MKFDPMNDEQPSKARRVAAFFTTPAKPLVTPSSTKFSRVQTIATAVLVAVVLWFLVASLRPWLWFLDTTPTGGDLGAHVWAPAYLRDVLLPEFRLTGWTHDWYVGFPAFTFYMVLPSLYVIIAEAGINLGEEIWAHLGVLTLAGFAGWRYLATRHNETIDPTSPSDKSSLTIPQRLNPVLWLGVAACTVAALCLLQILNLFDGRTVPTGLFGDVTYNDVTFDRAVAIVAVPAALFVLAWHFLDRFWISRPSARFIPSGATRLAIAVTAAVLGVLVVPLPYGIALKLIVVAGMVALPFAAFAMARMGGLAFPAPALAAAATLLFLFDRSFNIYGGNLLSTMAGEFAYSLGLAISVVYIGVAAKGMDSQRHWLAAGVLLALSGLTHLFSAFFALAATFALFVIPPWRRNIWRMRLKWTLYTGALAAALSAWWVVPFWWNRGLLNDMGWGKEERYVSALWSRIHFDYDFLVDNPPLKLFVVLAAIGAVTAIVRRQRLTTALALTCGIFAIAFVLLPEGRLWNVRLLPFYYLCIYLVALLGIASLGQVVLSKARKLVPSRKQPRLITVSLTSIASVAILAILVMTGLPLRSLPWGSVDDGTYQWGPFNSSEINVGSYWLEYDFEGYERKNPTSGGGGTSEYMALIETMEEVGATYGCGPSLWEYNKDRLASYGTPMAPMLLPYYSDGCIGSLEGLYFEASATAPYHFLMQSELSEGPSRAQRDLPYGALNVDFGAEHLRQMGVRYYIATTEAAREQARASNKLIELVDSGAWVVFGVSESVRVEALRELPIVVTDLDVADVDWLELSVGAFLMGETAPILATEGPEKWPRMSLETLTDELASARVDDLNYPGRSDRERAMYVLSEQLDNLVPRVAINSDATSDAQVSNIVRDQHSLRFDVDTVGVPVVVRTSYFPNWKADGADGPYRVTPNLMVVVPTSNHVELTYTRSPIQWASSTVSLIGLLALVAIPLRRHLRQDG